MSDNLIGATTAIFSVRLSNATADPVDVQWATRDGSAIGGTDYKPAKGLVTFLPGETEKQIEVLVYGQPVTPAEDKVFFINLSPPSNAVLVDALLTCRIVVDDSGEAPVTSIVVAEGRRGPKGVPGLNSYELAVYMGEFIGTLDEWMAKEANAARAAERAEAAAVAANIAGKVYSTPEAGVNPNTGVPVGDYFNVRSPLSTHYVDEYQNVGGAAVPTGKSYPSAKGLRDAKASAERSAAIAEAAATAATIGAGMFDTPADGVDPVTGVADGAYFNVRSSLDESYVDEYQNVGGSAVATGKSYPSASFVQEISNYTALPFKQGKSYAFYERVQLDSGDIVRSTAANNIIDPNVDMTGWVNLTKELFDYASISSLKDAEITKRVVNVGGLTYEWQAENSTTADDVYVVQSNKSTSGRWVQLEQNLFKTSLKDNLTGVFKARKKVDLDRTFSVSDTVDLGFDHLKVEGYGENTGFSWTGGDAPTQTDLALLKPILALKKSLIANAVSGAKLIDFGVDMKSAKNMCAVDARYITNGSKVEGIRVKGVGENSVGFLISKQWYSKYEFCYVMGSSSNRQGVGVYLDTRSSADTINQVNAVPLGISCRDLKIGYLIDPSRYVYELIIPAGVTIEKCGVGIKVVSPTSPVTTRSGIISAYFEKNDIDVEWGDITDTRALDQKITWLACSFADTGSHMIFNQGMHVLDGCVGLERLTVNNGALVHLKNTYVDIIENNTGNPDAIKNEFNPNSVASSSQFGSGSAKPLKTKSYTASLASGAGETPVTFDLYTNGALSSSVPVRGQKARIFAFARRSYETTTAQIWSGTLVRLSSGSYLIPDPTNVTGTATDPATSAVVGNVTASRAWGITASIDNSGILTLSSFGTDTKYYDVTVTAM